MELDPRERDAHVRDGAVGGEVAQLHLRLVQDRTEGAAARCMRAGGKQAVQAVQTGCRCAETRVRGVHRLHAHCKVLTTSRLSSSIDMASEFRELPPAFSSVHTRCACSVRPGATAAPKPKS